MRDFDDDLMILVLIGVLAVTFGVVNVGALSSTSVEWLVDRTVLVAGDAAVVGLPGGAGLDWPRLAVLAGAGMLLAVFAGRLRRLRGRADRDAAGRGGRPRGGAR